MKDGFTLVELLVALAVLGLLALMLSTSTGFGIAIWHRTDTIAESAVELALSREILAHDLTGAFPEWGVGADATPRVDFEGGPSRLTFLAEAPQSMGSAGVVRYTLSAADDGHRLELTAVRELDRDGVQVQSILLDRAASIEFSYWGAAGPDQPPSWQTDWRDRVDSPRLIRVRVNLPKGDERSWPDLIVQPNIAVDGNCLYDPLTYHCRGR